MDNILEQIDKNKFESFEPKLNNRFMVTWNDDFDLKSWVIRYVDFPTLMIDPSGNWEWDVMLLEMYDPISISTSFAVMDGLRKQKTFGIYTTDFKLQSIGPVGDVVEEWLIKGRIAEVSFGEGDWEDKDQKTVRMLFQPTDVILNF